ncbi:hypothetical protein C0Z17_03985 [Trinickia caryophylli]|nr:hypothetical protein C0Z17_03985 [Trinickia caryophylli]
MVLQSEKTGKPRWNRFFKFGQSIYRPAKIGQSDFPAFAPPSHLYPKVELLLELVLFATNRHRTATRAPSLLI